MRLRPHRRNPGGWSLSGDPAVGYDSPRFGWLPRTRRIRRCVRTGRAAADGYGPDAPGTR